MPDLRQALRDFVTTSNSGKYATEEELMSKFPELQGYDIQALRDFVTTSNSGKYSDEETLFSKFPEFGITGKPVQQQQPVQQQPAKKKEPTVSSSEGGWSDWYKPKQEPQQEYKPTTAIPGTDYNAPQKGPIQADVESEETWKRKVKREPEKPALPDYMQGYLKEEGKGVPFKEDKKYDISFLGRRTQEQIDDEVPEFIKPVIEKIDNNLLRQGKDIAKKELDYYLEDAGFKVSYEENTISDIILGISEDSPKNAITITAPDGEVRRFKVMTDDVTEADKIKQFVKEKSSLISEKDYLYKNENRKFRSKEEIYNEVKNISNQENLMNDEYKKYLWMEKDIKYIQSELKRYKDFGEENTPKYIQTSAYLKELQDEYQALGEKVKNKASTLIDQQKQLEKAAGKYLELQSEKGTFSGALYRGFMDSAANIYSQYVRLAFSGAVSIMPGSTIYSQEEFDWAYRKRLFDEGIIKRMDEPLDGLVMDKAKQAEISSQVDAELRDKFKKAGITGYYDGEKLNNVTTVNSIRENLSEFLNRPTSTTKEYKEKLEKEGGFVTRGLLGLSGSIPAMLGGPAIRITNMFMMTTDAVMREMDNDPDFANISENEKALVALPIGVVGAALEEFGFRNLVKGKSVTTDILRTVLGRVPSNASASLLRKTTLDVIAEMGIRGTTALVGAALSEAETGALQQVNEYLVKDIYNSMRGKKFDNPEFLSGQYFYDIYDAARTEAVGGFVMGVPYSAAAAFQKDGFQALDDTTFKIFEELTKDGDSRKFFVTSLKNKINQGEITAKQSQQMLDAYDQASGMIGRVPDEITDTKARKIAMDLISERKKLEGKREKYDDALAKPIQDKIDNINKQLTQLTEDAIQKQTTGEVSLQPESEPGKEMEAGGPEAGSQAAPKQGVLSPEEEEKLRNNRRVDLFPEESEFADVIGGSGRNSSLSNYSEVNGVGVASYTNPDNGLVDVIMSGTSDNDYVGYVRVYENGKPTNRWTSKMSNESGNKDNFKTMISEVQSRLPENHEYTESTNISIDGVRVYSNQLNRGYEVLTDANGNPVTNTVTLNAASVQGLQQATTQEEKQSLYDSMAVTTKEQFDALRDKITALMPNVNVTWNQANNTVELQLPVLVQSKKATTTDQVGTEQKTTQETFEQKKSEIEKITDPEQRKVAEIEFIMSNLMSGVGEASANKIREYADRIISGKETRDQVIQGLPKSFVDGIDQLLAAQQAPAVTTTPTATPAPTEVTPAEQFTEQDRARKAELEEAMRKADKRRKNITVGETTMPKAEAKAELDALNQKEQATQQPITPTVTPTATAPVETMTAEQEADLLEELMTGKKKEPVAVEPVVETVAEEEAKPEIPKAEEVAEVELEIKDIEATPEETQKQVEEFNEEALPEQEKPKAGQVAELSIDEINADPERFQYKEVTDKEAGVTEKFKGEKAPFKKELAGVISVWVDPADGKTYVINGHHRLDFAKRSGEKTMNVIYIDAKNASEARLKGAMQNIAEGMGTDMDAAKVFRETGMTVEQVQASGISVKGAKAMNGLALASLSDNLFNLVVQGKLSQTVGIIIGSTIKNQAVQEQFYNVIKGKNLNNGTIKVMAEDIQAAPTENVEQMDLFGVTATEQASYQQRASFIAGIRAIVSKAKNILGKAAKSKGFLEEYGNDIDEIASETGSRESAMALAVFDRLRNTSPEIRALIDKGVERIKNGENKNKILNETAKQIIEATPRILEGVTGQPVAGRGEVKEPGTKGKQGATGKKLADAVRKNLKIKGPDGLQSNILGILPAIWNAGVETMATAIEAGVAVTEAVQKAIEYIKEKHGKKFNEAAAEKKLLIGHYKGAIEIAREAKVTNEGLKTYFKRQGLTDAQIETLLKVKEKAEKKPISKEKVIGKPKPKKVTVNEMTALKDQLRLEAKAAREAKGDLNTKRKMLTAAIKEMQKKGKITVRQAAILISKVNSVNLDNPVMVERMLDYAEKVFNNAEFVEKMSRARKLLKTAKENIRTKIGVSQGLTTLMDKLFNINPNIIPAEIFEAYSEIVEMMGKRQAVLTLKEANELTKDVEKVLDVITDELSNLDELIDIFDNYENKVLDKDGKIDFSATLDKMLEDGTITPNDVKLYKKYKNKVLPREAKEKKTEQQLAEEKKELIDAIRQTKVDESNLNMREERDAARNLISAMTPENLNGLTNAELANLLKVLDNINNGFFPHYAVKMTQKLNATNRKETLGGAIKTAGRLPLTKLIANIKSLFPGAKSANMIMVIESPKYVIDQVFGFFKKSPIYDSVFKPVVELFATYKTDAKAISEKLEKAYNKVAKSHWSNPAKVKMSQFKMMTYALQLEYQSNKDKGEKFYSAAEYIKETIKHTLGDQSTMSNRDVQLLEKILNTYGVKDADGNFIDINIDKLYDSFNNAEKQAIKTIQEVNASIRDKAMFTAAAINGNKIMPIDNYVHHNVLPTGTNTANLRDPIGELNKKMNPSTRAAVLKERTPGAKPLNFNIFDATQKSANEVLMDFHLTEGVRTSKMVLSNLRKELEERGDKKQLSIFNAIEKSFETALENTLTNTFNDSTFVDNVVSFITKQAYRVLLAGVSRWTAELASNLAYVLKVDPVAYMDGITKYRKYVLSEKGPAILRNIKSGVQDRVYEDSILSGRMIDGSIMNEAIGLSGTTSNYMVVNAMQTIYNNTLKKGQNFVATTADTLISTPDKGTLRPFYIGIFAKEFKKITGQNIDLDKIAANDEAYLNKFKEAIDKSKDFADYHIKLAGGTKNPFASREKAMTVKNASALAQGYKSFNNFMNNFIIGEYIAARTGIYAMMGNGKITRKQGAAVLAGVVTRTTLYSLLVKELAAGLAWLFLGDDDEEDEEKVEKSLIEKSGQAFAGSMTSLILGRDFGNLTRNMINYGVEKVNENYVQKMIDGKYTKEDVIAFNSLIPSSLGSRPQFSDLLINMSGAGQPFLRSAKTLYETYFADEPKNEDTIKKRQNYWRYTLPLEIAGHLGFVPLYKDVKSVTNKALQREIDKIKSEKEGAISKQDAYKNYETLEEFQLADPEGYDEYSKDGGLLDQYRKQQREKKEENKSEKEKELDVKYGRLPFKENSMREEAMQGYPTIEQMKEENPDLYDQLSEEGGALYNLRQHEKRMKELRENALGGYGSEADFKALNPTKYEKYISEGGLLYKYNKIKQVFKADASEKMSEAQYKRRYPKEYRENYGSGSNYQLESYDRKAKKRADEREKMKEARSYGY